MANATTNTAPTTTRIYVEVLFDNRSMQKREFENAMHARVMFKEAMAYRPLNLSRRHILVIRFWDDAGNYKWIRVTFYKNNSKPILIEAFTPVEQDAECGPSGKIGEKDLVQMMAPELNELPADEAVVLLTNLCERAHAASTMIATYGFKPMIGYMP